MNETQDYYEIGAEHLRRMSGRPYVFARWDFYDLLKTKYIRLNDERQGVFNRLMREFCPHHLRLASRRSSPSLLPLLEDLELSGIVGHFELLTTDCFFFESTTDAVFFKLRYQDEYSITV